MTVLEVEGGYAEVLDALQTVAGVATTIHSVTQVIKGKWIIVYS